MVTKNVYEQLADMLALAPTGAPEMKTPEFMQILRLQYTPREARLAVQVGLSGGKLDELSGKTGIEAGKLKKMLNTMADKGTMWIDPGKEDPNYRAVGIVAPGLIETGVWGNVKYPYTVQLAKLLNKWKYDWTRHGLGKMGFPIAPVWPDDRALPDDADRSENVAELVKENEYWALGFCPCRLAHWIDEPGHHCEHMLETCMLMNDLGRWAVEHGMARELTRDQAVEHLRKCSQDGLVHTCYPNTVICNCCRDCCVFFIGLNQMGLTLVQRSAFVAESDQETCTACNTCAQRCPVAAIEVDEFAVVDPELCIGCGVCVATCKTKSQRLVRRPEAELMRPPAAAEAVGEG